MEVVREHGAAVVALCIDETGQARTIEHKVAVAERLLDTLAADYGLDESSVLVDCLTFTLGTGQEESRGDGVATVQAIRELKRRRPRCQTTLGLSNISFGLKPAARQVLNSVFLHECQSAGLDTAIVHASKILPMARIPDEQREAALDLVHDRRREGHDPLTAFLDVFEGVDAQAGAATRAEKLAALPLDERLARRVVDGERLGLEADLDEALTSRPALAIVNETLLAGMKTVGELFGAGQMQLPFVLQSAEVMKAAVAHLEPHMERTDDAGKGSVVLATVKGDVHDIGKNLVDIILTNNGYTVHNIGIKQPVAAILEAAEGHDADVVGMSGLLVKSTVVMKENLAEMNARGVAERFPVLLGGAALTRSFVEDDLAELYDGDVRYARDAFEGLRLMDEVMATTRGERPVRTEAETAAAEERRARRARSRKIAAQRRAKEEALGPVARPSRSDVAELDAVPVPPFWGSRVVKGVALADVAAYLDERALFLGQWGLKPTRGDGPGYDELVEAEGRPRLRMWLDRVAAEGTWQPAVAYGYFPAVSEGDDLVVLSAPEPDAPERLRFTFPRQSRDRHLCLADFTRSRDVARERGQVDVVAFHCVTMGRRVSEVTAELFARDAYREYLELHGLSVQLTEALAEMWHARIRAEMGVGGDDATDVAKLLQQTYRGERYSFGYPACPRLEDQVGVDALVDFGSVGVALSEEFQLEPEQSTSAVVFHHPEAVYFNAG